MRPHDVFYPHAMDYFDAYCAGYGYEDIAKRFRVTVGSARRGVLIAARHLGLPGFWKFYIRHASDIQVWWNQLQAKRVEYVPPIRKAA